jgi:hypothetical protein
VIITKKSITRWFYKLRKNFYKNSIYFATTSVSCQEYRNELCSTEMNLVHFCTPDDALVVRNILSFYSQILSQFVKPPSDTLLRYFNIFHLEPSPSSLQFIVNMFHQVPSPSSLPVTSKRLYSREWSSMPKIYSSSFSKLSITKYAINWLNIHTGRSCRHQELHRKYIYRNIYRVSKVCFFVILNLVNPRFLLS